jgi:TolA-binding protein
VGSIPLAGQIKPDQAADTLLNNARKASSEKNYAAAVGLFREFLAKYGQHKNVPTARYGLAVALLEGPAKDHTAAAEQLQMLVADRSFPEHPFVLYYLAQAKRGPGIRELEQAKPEDRDRRRAAAQQRFAEAAPLFEAAAKAFQAKAKAPAVDAKALPTEWEWAARARCDLAEMLLRMAKAKEARDAAGPFVKDRIWAKSTYRGQGLYYHGFACFLLEDYQAAGRSLNRLTPFTNTIYATHARYLLGRVHHLQEELAEALGHYEGVLADYEKFKKQAAEALRQPDRVKNDPEEKARLEALVRDPPPEHIARAAFYSGELLYAGGKFADALARFASIPQKHGQSPLLVEAQLRQGMCQVQLRQYAEAVKVLQPVADKEPRRAAQALLWIGKAQVGAADANNAQVYAQAMKAAVETLQRAAARAKEMTKIDPDAEPRLGVVLLELADTQQLARQFKEAAAIYETILKDKLLPERNPEVLQKQADALNLAGDYAASDKVCALFRQKYPRSPLRAAVIFRSAENAFFLAQAAEKNPDPAERAKALAKHTEEAGRRYQEVIDKFPEFAHVNHARYALGLLHHRQGNFEKAKAVLETIPQAERNGQLALTSYLLADCLVRLAPATAEDALAAGKLQEELQAAVELLDGFVAVQPNGPQTPDALLKLGLCHQRLATLLVKPEERNKVLGSARAAYEKLINQFPKHGLQPQGVFERAKCLALAGDKQGAINEFRRFGGEPLRSTPVAPLALLQLSVLLREQNKADEAAQVLEDCRKRHEKSLLQDKERAGWVATIRLHQALALQEARKFAPARSVLEALIKEFPNRPEVPEAALRRGQCLKEEARLQIDAGRKMLAPPNPKPEEIARARKHVQEGWDMLRQAVRYLDAQADQLKDKEAAASIRARMLYDAAWGYRDLAEPGIDAARDEVQKQRQEKRREATRKNPNQRPAAVTALPVVALVEIKLQPAEAKARACYRKLIDGHADLPLANDARLELAELFTQREEYDAAIKLLDEALDKEPPPELTAKVRLLLGTCHAAKKDFKAALAQIDAVAQDPKGPLVGQAHYRAGECLVALKDYAKAVARLAVFRDQQPFQNVPGLTDRALLALGRAYAEQKQWDPSRQAFELVVARFGSSPWIHEARFGIGQAWENQKQYDNAVNVFSQVTSATATATAAKAQFHIGLCRLAQGRHREAAAAFLAVPYTYDYPEWSAAALCEAARAYVEDKKDKNPDRAKQLYLRVIKEYPRSEWAKIAAERLKELKDGDSR